MTSIFDHASGAAKSEISPLTLLSDVSIFTYCPLGEPVRAPTLRDGDR